MSRFVLGEFKRSIDERYRISIPVDLVDAIQTGEGDSAGGNCILAKERPGALSLWHADDWGPKLEKDVALIRSKIEAGHLRDRVTDVQLLGRLLSTRHREVQIAGRGRLNIPESFREFLGIEPNGDVMVIGAAVCVEIWRPDAWITYLDEQIPKFGTLVDQLAG